MTTRLVEVRSCGACPFRSELFTCRHPDADAPAHVIRFDGLPSVDDGSEELPVPEWCELRNMDATVRLVSP